MASDKQGKLAAVYVQLAKELGRHPTRSELIVKSGYSKDNIRGHFGNFTKLKEFVIENFSQQLVNVVDQALYNPKKYKELSSDLKKYRRYVITTAVGGAPVHKGALAAVKSYCEKNNAAFIVIPANNDLANLSKDLENEYVLFDDIGLNKSLHLSTIKIGAKQINPTTGLQRIGQRDGSFMFASPKQVLNNIAVAGRGIPHVLMTTGAITEPVYQGKLYIQRRTDFIATQDHVMGALVVELEEDGVHFHFRQIQFEPSGNFIDLGNYYHADGTVGRINAKSLVLGDYHSGETDQTVVALLPEMVDVLKPEEIILHDLFDGTTISHHKKNSGFTLALEANLTLEPLKAELQGVANDLNFLGSLVKRIVVVKSNHDIFLDRRIEDDSWIFDKKNYKQMVEIIHAKLNGHTDDALKYGVETNGLKAKNIKWLKEDESYVVAGIQLGAHGHRGNNGAKGTLAQMEIAYGQSVTGHAHTPAILRGAWQVGTSSILDPDYAKGASSWMHTHCVVYPNGARQLISVINGKWKIDETAKV